LFWCGVKSKRIGFFHVSHFSIYLVNALVFNGKASNSHFEINRALTPILAGAI
jgi:hypothetical protein